MDDSPAKAFRSLTESTFVREVEVLSECPSTNDHALQQIRAATEFPTPRLVLAERQTAGRGRGDHRWWSGDGALTFSLIIHADDAGLAPQHWPQLSLATGLALREAVAPCVPGSQLQLKWPNDLYLDGRKLAGILVEAPNVRRGMIVVGIGLNVNNSLHQAPRELQAIATTLVDHTRRQFDRAPLLEAILRQLESIFHSLGTGQASLPDAWNPHCLLRGKRVRVRPAGGDPDSGEEPASRRDGAEAGRDEANVREGIVLGIDTDGALLLQSPSGLQRCVGGVVEWRGT